MRLSSVQYGSIGRTMKKGVRIVKRAGMVRVGLYLSEVQTKRIRALAKKKGLTVSEMIRRMIDEGLERIVKP